MHFFPDDPQITAFALGEIDDAAEVKRIEAAVAASPELREAVDSIRATSAALSQALAAEPAPEMTSADKAALQAHASPPKPEAKRSRPLLTLFKVLGASAVLGIIASIFIPTVGRVRESARMSPERSAERQAYYQRMIEAEQLGTRGYYDDAQDIRARSEPWNTDAFDPIIEAGFRSPMVEPLSTLSIDVDTASYAKVREFIMRGQLPPPDAVRLEELINYFPYQDSPPARSPAEGGDPFAVHVEQASAPWASEHRLLRVNLKGYELPWADRPASNLVFLIDVSGSMNSPNRLPLVKGALRLLTDRLDERDRVAIVVYAGASGIALPSTTANNSQTIRHALDRLQAGGSTNAGQGITLAYATAREFFIKGGNNKVILCTDGDFNVGITDRGQLGELVQQNADEGISLTVLGFGMGNYKDNMLEDLSTQGKGTYGYIDTGAEARKFFLQQLASNLFTIAHDVKIQTEFNPAKVQAYRLIGYENRMLEAEEFNDDATRAGDIGPGHTVTAFYEIIPPGVPINLSGVDPLRYQAPATLPAEEDEGTGELATIKVRFKRPGEEKSELLVQTVSAESPVPYEDASEDFRFGAAVAAFGMRLRQSPHVADYSWREIRNSATTALGQDRGDYRTEFIEIITRASRLTE